MVSKREKAGSEYRVDWIKESTAAIPEFLTIPEAARFLRMSERQVYRLGATGRLVLLSKGGHKCRRIVPKASLVAYLRTLEVAA